MLGPRVVTRVALTGLGIVAVATRAAAGDDDALVARARNALRRATAFITTISTEGGYLWSYSVDLRDRRGEGHATPTQIWVQPPGTPAVGSALLAAWRATGDRIHLEAAERAGEALARGQLASGGWEYSIDFAPEAFVRSYRRTDIGRLTPAEAARRRNLSVLDDDNTTSVLRFLLELKREAEVIEPARRAAIGEAFEYGRRALIAAQHPNGAWPQMFDGPAPGVDMAPIRRASIPTTVPPYRRDPFFRYYTLNDHVHADVIRTLLAIWRVTGDPDSLKAARRAGEFLILAQLPEPQPAWAQQYNFAMEPAWARSFEPPAVCTAESVGAIRALIELSRITADERFLAPIPAAIAWLERSAISSNRWARFYELRTNRPIYGDRDGRIHYTLAEISEERRTGYAWEGHFGIPALLAEWHRNRGRRDPVVEQRPTADHRDPQLRNAAIAAIEAQDEHGRWLVHNRIETREFCRRVHDVCRWLHAAGLAPADPSVSPPQSR